MATLPGKVYLYKIFDKSGNFITTWKDVITSPQFSVEINGGFSDMTIELARSIYSFGEGVDIAYGNQLKLYAFDMDTGDDGVCIYSGFISSYEPDLEGSKEVIKVTFLGYWTETNLYMLESGSSTLVSYLTESPLTIIQDVLTKFNSAGGRLMAGTSDNPGTVCSYDFNCNTVQEALTQCVTMSPYQYFLRTDSDDKLYMKLRNASGDHIFHVGRNIANYRQEKRTESIVNVVYFSGGDPGTGTKLYNKYTASGSVSSYGRHAYKIVDERVTVESTADNIANRQISFFSNPEIRITIDILDNNNQEIGKGYDIESIKVGDTCYILGSTTKGYNLWDSMIWDSDSWDYNISNSAATVLQIMKITYTPGMATLEVSNRQPDISKRIEDVNRNLVNFQTANNPSTPLT